MKEIFDDPHLGVAAIDLSPHIAHPDLPLLALPALNHHRIPGRVPGSQTWSALKCQVSVQDVLWSSSLVGLTRLQCRPTALLHYTPFILGVQRRKLQFNSLPNPGKKRHKFLHKQAERVSRPGSREAELSCGKCVGKIRQDRYTLFEETREKILGWFHQSCFMLGAVNIEYNVGVAAYLAPVGGTERVPV